MHFPHFLCFHGFTLFNTVLDLWQVAHPAFPVAGISEGSCSCVCTFGCLLWPEAAPGERIPCFPSLPARGKTWIVKNATFPPSQGWDTSQWSSQLVETFWKPPFGDQILMENRKYSWTQITFPSSQVPEPREGEGFLVEMEVDIWVHFPWRMFSVESSNGSC